MDPFALDAETAERLLAGAVDVSDAPPQYRAVAATFLALQDAPEIEEVAGGEVTTERITNTVGLERTVGAVPHARRSRVRARIVAVSVAACGLVLIGGLAAAGVLPEKAQGVAASVLRQVGISVPDGGDEPADRRVPVTTSNPVPTTAPPVQATPAGDSLDVPPSSEPTSPAPAVGTGPSLPNDTPPRETPSLAPPGDGGGQSPVSSSPEDGQGSGRGNADGHGSNGNGNPGGKAKANGHEAAPPEDANAGGNGKGNANGLSVP